MTYDRDEWERKYRLAERLVQREIYYCVSYLMSTLSRLACETNDPDLDYDEIMEVMVQDDWEEPVNYFINHDADLDQLEWIADQFGWWSDVLEESVDREVVEFVDLDGDSIWFVQGDSEWHVDEDDANARAIELCEKAIRKAVWMLVTTPEEYREVADEFNLDPNQREAYEHWLVSGWLANRLKDEGEMIGEICGLTVWGRCCTGQSISMDGVMQKIACDIWPEECRG